MASLYDMIWRGWELQEKEKDAIIEVLCKKCDQATKGLMWRRLSCLSILPLHGVYGRLLVRPEVSYQAGQSRVEEVRELRKLILRG
jgi:hypothetical protein